MRLGVNKSIITSAILISGLIVLSYSKESTNRMLQSRSPDQSVWTLDSVYSSVPVRSFHIGNDTIVFSGLKLDSISFNYYSNEKYSCMKNEKVGMVGANAFYTVNNMSANIAISRLSFCLNADSILYVTDFENLELYFKLSRGKIPEFLNEKR